MVRLCNSRNHRHRLVRHSRGDPCSIAWSYLIFEGVILEFLGLLGNGEDSVGYVLGKGIFDLAGNREVGEVR
jgi:hypothetical protein